MDLAPLSWDHCRSFLGVCRTGSLSAAARASGQTQPTIARHIAQLEDALGGGALFIRSPQGLTPTDKAGALLPHALAMEASAAAMLRAASGNTDEIAGTVRITASVVIGVEVLPGILTGISADYPNLDFEVVPSNQTADLLRRDADIAVRMVRPSQGALVAQSVGDIMLGMFAREDYLARRGTPQRLEDLASHAVIGVDRDTASLQSLKPLGVTLTREMFAFRSDSDLAQLAAVRGGFGIGICQTVLARRMAGMVRLFPQEIALPLGTWITMHEDLRGNRRMRLVFDRLVSAVGAYARETQAP
ncbi:MAG: LysR family transcriptional regulator [Alphaproteobacteria bacterium]|uniref:LysR family transcriptional regulator n=1 Tax=Hyphomonas sp. TaxID=87 RepID=UPI001DD3A113|nr:LysR family transcriptional regulator [Hyphomonas sp.]MBU3920052.1 LysR family transcriptional regulator [Alphaproteobacteria bacterium]MBU4062042.1 LysR family transcriptional regulator [Alphaproteobacteria bacterium]MBU4164978.1 LysR family transcriptional regulator [Alphaproteobacteria bacterium]MBU4569491.1 LysR family transcriptional regulator [Alphaproteobacteria bacterium]